ncbi:MAG: methyltransferase domain-containing protein [Bdellovibrionaceae bacterium]|nr:methyltransferase domain-containing protein [Pseudobdellovibrionaceae bacterium]
MGLLHPCYPDSSEKMLESARLHEQGSLKFMNGDIASWREPARFDVIFSNAALQWCPGHEELFSRLKESLRPGGQIAIQMPMNHDYATHLLATSMSAEEPWNSLLHGETYDKSQHILKPEDYAALLFRLGFRDQQVLQRVYGHQLESREDVIEWVKGSLLTYFQKRLSKDDYERFLGDYRYRLFERLRDEKPFFYPFKRIFIWARL